MTEKILRVNMWTKSVCTEELPADLRFLGGRALTARILSREVAPTCDPLGSDNKLIICPGPLAGTMAPSFGRTSVGAKSPLTGGIKEANVGGPSGQKLGKLKIRAVIIEGRPREGAPHILKIDRRGTILLSASELRGKRNYEVAATLRRHHGNSAAVISVGPCGEMELKSASIAFTDSVGRPSRHAARGGLGAVMGSKGLKAIVIDDGPSARLDSHDSKAFREALKSLLAILRGPRGIPPYRSTHGTAGALNLMNARGCLPTRNFRQGSFSAAEKISGEALKELSQSRGAHMHACMPGCIVKCSNDFNDEHGEEVTASFEFETIALMGSNLCIDDLDTIARMDRICDDLGIDTIETGNALGLCMEAGLLSFGDGKKAIGLLEEIGVGTAFGRILGNGALATAGYLGIDRVAHARGQGLPAHDPRVSKVAGVTYSTSAMGADHTAGVDYSGDPSDKETAIGKSKSAQIMSALVDGLGYCLLALPLDKTTTIEPFAKLLQAHFGTSFSPEDLLWLASETIRDELAFNEAAGLPSDRVYLADFLTTEALPPRDASFDVDRNKMKEMWKDHTAKE